MPSESAFDGYRNKRKKRTNVSINPELVEIAQKIFPATKYGSLSGFIDAEMARAFSRMVPKLRALGIKIPEHLLKKS